jgi:hypothetical protein
MGGTIIFNSLGDSIETTTAGAAEVMLLRQRIADLEAVSRPLVSRTFWVIQERLAPPCTSVWRDSGEHHQPKTLQWDKNDAKRRIQGLRENNTAAVMEYRLIRREIQDYVYA